MRIILDAHFSPVIARWITEHPEIEADAISLRDLGLRESADNVIFDQLNGENDVVLSKDIDFYNLVARRSPPPKVIWLRCGNRCNEDLKIILLNTLPEAIRRLKLRDPAVEILLESSE